VANKHIKKLEPSENVRRRLQNDSPLNAGTSWEVGVCPRGTGEQAAEERKEDGKVGKLWRHKNV